MKCDTLQCVGGNGRAHTPHTGGNGQFGDLEGGMVKGGMGGMVDNMGGGMSDSKRDIDGLEGSETSLVSKTRDYCPENEGFRWRRDLTYIFFACGALIILPHENE